jgi:hypothetical protein
LKLSLLRSFGGVRWSVAAILHCGGGRAGSYDDEDGEDDYDDNDEAQDCQNLASSANLFS